MIATLVVIYVIGFIAMMGFVFIMSIMGSLFDSPSMKNFLWAAVAGILWPVLLLWSGVVFVKYKIKG